MEYWAVKQKSIVPQIVLTKTEAPSHEDESAQEKQSPLDHQ